MICSNLLFDIRRKGRTGTNERTVTELKQARVLFVQPKAVALLIHGLDALPEIGIHGDRIKLARQHRVDLGLERPELIVRVRTGDIAESRGNVTQQLTCQLQCHDRVLEGRRLGVAHDGVDFGAEIQHPFLHGGHVMAVFNRRERRHAVWRIPLFHERISRKFGLSDGNLVRCRRGRCFSRFLLIRAAACTQHQRDQTEAYQPIEFHNNLSQFPRELLSPPCGTQVRQSGLLYSDSSREIFPMQLGVSAYVYRVSFRYKRFT